MSLSNIPNKFIGVDQRLTLLVDRDARTSNSIKWTINLSMKLIISKLFCPCLLGTEINTMTHTIR